MQFRPCLSTCLGGLAIWMVAGAFGGQTRADVLPDCGASTLLVSCAAADEGKACPSGGKCYDVRCESTTATPGMTKVYRCDTCPTIVTVPSGTCTVDNMGSTCGDGDGGTATCGAIQPYCNTTPDKFVCHRPAGASTGTAGAGAPSTSGGCDVGPRPSPTSFIGLGLVGVGLLFFSIDRRRRRR